MPRTLTPHIIQTLAEDFGKAAASLSSHALGGAALGALGGAGYHVGKDDDGNLPLRMATGALIGGAGGAGVHYLRRAPKATEAAKEAPAAAHHVAPPAPAPEPKRLMPGASPAAPAPASNAAAEVVQKPRRAAQAVIPSSGEVFVTPAPAKSVPPAAPARPPKSTPRPQRKRSKKHQAAAAL